MRDLLSRNRFSSNASRDSWFSRVCENFQQLITPARVFPSSANGAPLHLPRWERSERAGRAQRVSLLTHAAILTALVMIAFNAPQPRKTYGDTPIKGTFRAPQRWLDLLEGGQLRGGTGSGGGRIPIPTTTGNLPPLSSIQIVRPSLPPKQDSVMPVPPTILDPSSAPVLTPVEKIGLPWMQEDTNSPGPGASNTIGSGPGKTMGDSSRDGPGGVGQDGLRYQAGTTLPKCAYCPDPVYTDQAREAKLQGRVLLRVLVGADGHAGQVQILQGLGLGLDERAAETVHTWKFVPGQDAWRRAVSVWVTIEVTFRLF